MNARDLTSALSTLYRNERSAMADFLVALADFDRQRGWDALGHASLFDFNRRELRMSAGSAHTRATAARLIQRFPEVADHLRSGVLCLTTVNELSKVLTPENRDDVLPRFFGLSRREAALLSAALRPAPVIPVRDVVRPARTVARVSVPPPAVGPAEPPPQVVAAANAFRPGETHLTPVTAAEPAPLAAPVSLPLPPAPAPLPDREKPLSADQARLSVTVSVAFLGKLDAAKDALAHAMPGATTGELLERGLDLLLADSEKRKGALTEKPLKRPRPSRTDAIPAHVRREVWKRSGGSCEVLLANGERCGSRHKLELDHINAAALGGEATVENLRVACRSHHLAHARRVFGDHVIDRYTKQWPAPGSPPVLPLLPHPAEAPLCGPAP